jgi:hypothetical protein
VLLFYHVTMGDESLPPTVITSTTLANSLTYTATGLSQNTRYSFASPSRYSNTAVIDYVPTPSNLMGTAINEAGQPRGESIRHMV